MGQGLLITRFSRSHSGTPHSIGLLWTSAQLITEIYFITEYKTTIQLTPFNMHFFLRYQWSLTSSRNAPHFMEFTVYSHVHINIVHFPLISQKHSPHLPSMYLKFLLMLSSHLHIGQMASFHQVFHSNLSSRFSSLPHMLYSPHTLPSVIDQPLT